MDERNFLKSVSEAISDNKKSFVVPIASPTILDRIRFVLGLAKPYRRFKVKPLVIGKLAAISRIMLAIDATGIDAANVYEKAEAATAKYTWHLARMIAISVCKGRSPSKTLVKFFRDNLTIEDMTGAVALIRNQNDTITFLNGIVSLKALSLIEMMNPKVEETNKASTDTSEQP